MFTVVDPSSMRLEGSVPAEALNQVRLGAPVTFTVNGYPGRTFTGRVTRVNPTADPATRQVRDLYLDSECRGQAGWRIVREWTTRGDSRTGLVAPVNAVDARSNVPSVFRIKAGKVAARPS